MTRPLLAALLAGWVLAGCGADGEGGVEREGGRTLEEPCRLAGPARPLPSQIPESSGAAISRRHDGVVWTHNDSGWPAELFAVDVAGRLLATIPVAGAESVDWEDIALAECAAGHCLYVADIGDNRARRNDLVIYRLPEPDPARGGPVAADAFPVRYPDGPRDAEALFVLPPERLFVVTKGRHGAITIFRYPGEPREGETVELEPVRSLSAGPAPVALADQVTGADATLDGGMVAIRTYASLLLYDASDLLEGRDPVVRVGLAPVGEAQGEGVAVHENGTVVLTSEGVQRGLPGAIAVVTCRRLSEAAGSTPS